jgi:hypothetical protein
MDTPKTPELRLSPSEKRTLKYIAQGELLDREMDWLAIQPESVGSAGRAGD